MRRPNRRLLRFAIMVALALILLTEPVRATSPVLTGRWGETRLPQQLAYDYPSKKSQALVVVAFSTVCPLARRVVPDLNALQQKYDDHGIQFIALFSNGSEDLNRIAHYAVEMQLSFPVYKDDPLTPWHQQLGLEMTPAVVVLDTRNGFEPSAVVYRGQINGMWFGGGTAGRQREYLAEALDRFLQGEPPAIPETAFSGCAIVPRAFHDLSRFQNVTYYRDITRLIQRRCASCHHEGEPGAELFSAFESYQTVAALSKVMLSRMENRLMPPWQAITDDANGLGGFQNDVRLTDDEISKFRAWVEQECPPGDPHDAPPRPTWRAPGEWRIGTPDFVFEMPQPYHVPTSRLDEYQYYRIPANFPEDRYIQAIELKPGNKAVVHHIGAIVGPSTNRSMTANQAMLWLYGLTGEKVKKIGDWIAGDPFNARRYPDGYALKLPAGHDLFFEMHYTPTGREEEPDQSKMSIIWAPREPAHVLDTKVFNRKDIRLPPHALHYEKKSYYLFSSDVLIHALAPHMHFRGKDFTLYKIENPQSDDQRRQLILQVAAYDFNWQRTYEFQRPIRLKAGDALYSVAHFDNSHYNPNNPDPEALVRFGLKSDQEMLNLRVKFERVDFGETPPTQ